MKRGLVVCSATVALFLIGGGLAWSHPGDLDVCGGHTEMERVEYPLMANGQPTVPSEPGEYHFHFTQEQMDQEVLPSLREYRRRHALALRALMSNASAGEAIVVNDALEVVHMTKRIGLGMTDYGSFTVGDKTYDIWEYTRQQEAILHCQGDDEVLHTGIARILSP